MKAERKKYIKYQEHGNLTSSLFLAHFPYVGKKLQYSHAIALLPPFCPERLNRCSCHWHESRCAACISAPQTGNGSIETLPRQQQQIEKKNTTAQNRD
jgi:hypothetical protein